MWLLLTDIPLFLEGNSLETSTISSNDKLCRTSKKEKLKPPLPPLPISDFPSQPSIDIFKAHTPSCLPVYLPPQAHKFPKSLKMY